MFGWQPPSGANPLEGALASAAPIEGLGALTGYWFLDVFAAMNVVLILSLVFFTRGDDEDEDAKGARAAIPDACMCRTRVKYVPRVRAASNASTSVDFCEQCVRCTTTRSSARAKKRRRRV